MIILTLKMSPFDDIVEFLFVHSRTLSIMSGQGTHDRASSFRKHCSCLDYWTIV